jgi:hypothetical protein
MKPTTIDCWSFAYCKVGFSLYPMQVQSPSPLVPSQLVVTTKSMKNLITLMKAQLHPHSNNEQNNLVPTHQSIVFT